MCPPVSHKACSFWECHTYRRARHHCEQCHSNRSAWVSLSSEKNECLFQNSFQVPKVITFLWSFLSLFRNGCEVNLIKVSKNLRLTSHLQVKTQCFSSKTRKVVFCIRFFGFCIRVFELRLYLHSCGCWKVFRDLQSHLQLYLCRFKIVLAASVKEWLPGVILPSTYYMASWPKGTGPRSLYEKNVSPVPGTGRMCVAMQKWGLSHTEPEARLWNSFPVTTCAFIAENLF